MARRNVRPPLSQADYRLTKDGLPVHSFRSLLGDLATLARNTVVTAITPNYPLTVLTRPTPIQHKAFDLLGITPVASSADLPQSIPSLIQDLARFRRQEARCKARYEVGGANREAMEDCTEALRLSPDYADAYCERGVIRAQSYGDNQAALQDFNTAIRLRPNFARALFKRGNTKARLNDLQGALADYNETLRLDPKSADAYFNRGVVFYKLGDQRTALADLQQAQGLYSAAGDQGGAQRSASAAREVQSTPPPPRR